jgi:hypothetical protein
MKKLFIISVFLLLANCSLPKNPDLVFGKKCLVEGDQVTYSYVWIYDKALQTKPSAEQCQQLQD